MMSSNSNAPLKVAAGAVFAASLGSCGGLLALNTKEEVDEIARRHMETAVSAHVPEAQQDALDARWTSLTRSAEPISPSAEGISRFADQLFVESARVRRENAHELLPTANEAKAVADANLRRHEAGLEAATDLYAERYSFLERTVSHFIMTDAAVFRAENVRPLSLIVGQDEAALEKVSEAREAIAAQTKLVETRTSYKSGIAGVYNPRTGKVEWKESYMSGVAGVYNPRTESVEWKVSYKSGVAGVYNPTTGQIEWKTSYCSGIAGVYNPRTGQVEWEDSYQSGVAGVYNPATGNVEWKKSYHSGVAGYYDAAQQRVVFEDSYQSGVAIVYYDAAERTYKSSYGYVADSDD